MSDGNGSQFNPDAFAKALKPLFESVRLEVAGVGTRLESVEKRLESIDTRLESVDARLESVDTRLGSVDARLESVDTRLESVDTRLGSVDARLESVDTRLGSMDGRLGAVETRLDILPSAIAGALAPQFVDLRIHLDRNLAVQAEQQGQINFRLDQLEDRVTALEKKN